MRVWAASAALEGILHVGLYEGKKWRTFPTRKLLYCALYLRASARRAGESLFLYQVHLSLYFTFLNS